MLAEGISLEKVWWQVKKDHSLRETFGGSYDGRLGICLLQTCSFKARLKPEYFIWMRTVNSKLLMWQWVDESISCKFGDSSVVEVALAS